jgi:hypothetical protein
MRIGLFFFIFWPILFSCTEEQENKEISPAIYHWKSVYKPSIDASNSLNKLKINKQYIRFFDIDYNAEIGDAVPKGMVRFGSKPTGKVVPVIYITNKTFLNLGQNQVDSLAKNTTAKIKEITLKNDISFDEVQFDCDWSKKTGPSYFSFIDKVRSHLDETTKISATLRLHQVKFREQTGIPPVERVALMLYNVGDWTNVNTQNSLFDPDIIDQYIYRLPEYPLPVDIALPIYQQAIVFRNNQFQTYFKNVSKLDLKKEFNMKSGKEPNILVCQENCEFRNHSFRKGDVFRHESIDFETLNAVKKAILKRLPNSDVQIYLFHLDDKSIDNFSTKQLKKLLQN